MHVFCLPFSSNLLCHLFPVTGSSYPLDVVTLYTYFLLPAVHIPWMLSHFTLISCYRQFISPGCCHTLHLFPVTGSSYPLDVVTLYTYFRSDSFSHHLPSFYSFFYFDKSGWTYRPFNHIAITHQPTCSCCVLVASDLLM